MIVESNKCFQILTNVRTVEQMFLKSITNDRRVEQMFFKSNTYSWSRTNVS